ncbi:hypothetical protein [Hansschlegelia zhihuaiae]|uniref:Uncharacterized protein n=1 Tax=Hansschlegelia zhihuaiae TaxID=405005 RepID=A0A4Q0MHV5_9HYPH|nr:hypothetical protein [Hansschlegelia zhihuaiae]RXF72893.1 hypothetical protein EK403_12105 [Hansschlegelia zhihuaiae]
MANQDLSIVLGARPATPERWSLTQASLLGVAVGLVYGLVSVMISPSPLAIDAVEVLASACIGLGLVAIAAGARNVAVGAK